MSIFISFYLSARPLRSLARNNLSHRHHQTIIPVEFIQVKKTKALVDF